MERASTTERKRVLYIVVHGPISPRECGVSRAMVDYGVASMLEVMCAESNLLQGSDNSGDDIRRSCRGVWLAPSRVMLHRKIQNNSSIPADNRPKKGA